MTKTSRSQRWPSRRRIAAMQQALQQQIRQGLDLPSVGQTIRNRYGFTAMVAEVFKTNSQYPGMILEWIQDGRKRGQAFTTKDWREKWEVVTEAAPRPQGSACLVNSTLVSPSAEGRGAGRKSDERRKRDGRSLAPDGVGEAHGKRG